MARWLLFSNIHYVVCFPFVELEIIVCNHGDLCSRARLSLLSINELAKVSEPSVGEFTHSILPARRFQLDDALHFQVDTNMSAARIIEGDDINDSEHINKITRADYESTARASFTVRQLLAHTDFVLHNPLLFQPLSFSTRIVRRPEQINLRRIRLDLRHH